MTDAEKAKAWINDEQSAKIEFLEQAIRDMAIQFDFVHNAVVDLQITAKKIATVNVQLMRGLQELDETCLRKPTDET